MSTLDQQELRDESDLQKYRIELPNMADDELDPFEFRLYAHYKRRGNCHESVRTTAKATKMSIGMVAQTRDALAAKGWITVEEQQAYRTLLVKVVDRWMENFERYAGRSPHEQSRSPHEPKNTTTTRGGENGRPTIARVFTDNLHPNISPFDMMTLDELENAYGYDAVISAIKEASATKGADKRLVGVKYIQAICAGGGKKKNGVPANYAEGWHE
ncbi:MAG TPA: hypothetical protein VGQ71_14330 [Terriglobales bacterium]|jgi:hypothetical protein|nr:hypothetical protein [Terriglobales bacterium]